MNQRPRDGFQYIYFIVGRPTSYCTSEIKIGKTEQKICDRMRSLQTGNPTTLRLYKFIEVPIAQKIESVAHD